ncbi:hypothetical protein Tsp_14003, partial [Trichinella spiralis]|uniref:hypothetical protein n=1 Tax=Trichinella spiralis TaxID=6334 RepID=UPI0001EFE09C
AELMRLKPSSSITSCHGNPPQFFPHHCKCCNFCFRIGIDRLQCSKKKKCIYKYRQFTKATHSTSDGSLYRGIVCKSICEPSELLYSREPRVIVSERSRIVSMKSIILVYFEKLAGCVLLARNKKRDIAMI